MTTQTLTEPTTIAEPLLTLQEVMALLKCGRSKVYRMMDEDEESFPRPFKIGRANRWLRVEVEAWIEHQAQARASFNAA